MRPPHRPSRNLCEVTGIACGNARYDGSCRSAVVPSDMEMESAKRSSSGATILAVPEMVATPPDVPLSCTTEPLPGVDTRSTPSFRASYAAQPNTFSPTAVKMRRVSDSWRGTDDARNRASIGERRWHVSHHPAAPSSLTMRTPVSHRGQFTIFELSMEPFSHGSSMSLSPRWVPPRSFADDYQYDHLDRYRLVVRTQLHLRRTNEGRDLHTGLHRLKVPPG